MKISLGISTCPNDTFTFHAILNNKIDLLGLSFEIHLCDIEALNKGLIAGDFDCSKVSFFTALKMAAEYELLPAGAALGLNVGPIIVARQQEAVPLHDSAILCPGELTTAAFLFRCFYPHCANIKQVLFSEIMAAVAEGSVNFGVVIHEGRFTYQNYGLFQIADLGRRWEEDVHAPLPLGGVLCHSGLADSVKIALAQVISNSLQYAHLHREETFATMQRYAQELDREVIWAHVETYVNEYTLKLGSLGIAAIRAFEKKARQTRLLPERSPQLRIVTTR
jgi:1,4-dihydroxy-6-naphthoate synthase